MRIVEEIKELIYEAGKPLPLSAIKEKLIDSSISSDSLKEIISSSQEQLIVTDNGLIDLPGSGMYKYQLNLSPVMQTQGELINIYFDKLSEIFEGSNLQQPEQHFASLLLFDRLLNFHFKQNTSLNDLSNKYNSTVVYTSGFQVHHYLKLLKELNQIEELQEALKGVIILFEQEPTERLKRAYYDAFNVCMEFRAHQFDPILFGKMFCHTLRIRFLNKKSGSEYSSPRLIGKLISRISEVKPGMVIYDPAVGIGSFFVELAHHHNVYDFKAIGMDINWGSVILCKINLLLNGIIDFEIKDGDSLLDQNIPDESVDLAIANPPFGNLMNGMIYKFSIDGPNYGGFQSSELAALFIQHMLCKTKANGRVISVVSDNLLSSEKSMKFRKHIFENELIERVISFPIGTFPNATSVSASLLVLSKNKSRKKSIRFQNGSEAITFYNRKGSPSLSEYEVDLFINGIVEIKVPVKGDDESMFIPNAVVSPSVVEENNFDLRPVIYTHEALSEISKAKQEGVRFIKLDSILLVPETKKATREDYDMPYIRVKDLIKHGGHLQYSDVNMISPPKINENINGRILENRALLVARVGSDLKPTILHLNAGEKVIIDRNVHFFIINTSEVVEAYLLAQLNSDLVKQQAEIYRTSVAAQSLSWSKFINIEIPLPPVADQIEWVAKNIRKGSEQDEIAAFIKHIPLIETDEDLKKEIERFTQLQFQNSQSCKFQSVLDSDIFPFSKTDLESFIRVKKSKNKSQTLILLDDDNRGVFGAIIIEDDSPIDYKKSALVNSYSNFLFNIYNYLTRTSTNRQLERFAHTTKNYLAGINGRLSEIINSDNKEFINAMKSINVETEKQMEWFLKHGKNKNDFTLFSHLNEIAHSISGIASFYFDTDKHFKNIQEPKSVFPVSDIISKVKEIHPGIEIKKPEGDLKVISKPFLIMQAMLDLIQNATKYSSDKHCTIEIAANDTFVSIFISNPVNELLLEEKYSVLGRDWLKDESTQNIHYGLYQSFQAIREADAKIELIDYETYRRDKIFAITIKLPKSTW